MKYNSITEVPMETLSRFRNSNNETIYMFDINDAKGYTHDEIMQEIQRRRELINNKESK